MKNMWFGRMEKGTDPIHQRLQLLPVDGSGRKHDH